MTGNRIARIVLGIFFVALLATPCVHQAHFGGTECRPIEGRCEDIAGRHGFYLEEVSHAAGINFVHQSPKLDPKLDPIMPEVASMGASVSIVDFDRDGWPDIYVTNSAIGSKNALYRNMHDGTFKDVAGELGIADVNQEGTGVSTGAVWGDYDNDGYEDLFLIKWGRPELFHNDQGHGFTRVSEQAGLPSWINANTAIWFDYDGDGLLDLFVGGYYAEDIDLWHLTTTRIMPDSFEYAKNGGRKYLFHNLGNGKFEEVSAKVGIDSHRWALAAAAADLRGTGHPDLFVSNDYGVSELYFNDGKRFREVGEQTGVGFAPKSGMNAAFGDILNQGRYAVYVSNISEDGILIQGNNLWVPKEGTDGRRHQISESGARLRRRTWRLEFRRAVRRFEQRWNARPLFDQWLHLARPQSQLLVRLLESRRRKQYDHWRCQELAGVRRAQPVGLSEQARLAQRRRGQVCRCGAGRRRDRYLRWTIRGAGGFVESRRARRGRRQSERPVAGLQEYGRARERMDRIRVGRNEEQSQRDRRAGHAVLEWPAAGAGSFRRQRLRGAE